MFHRCVLLNFLLVFAVLALLACPSGGGLLTAATAESASESGTAYHRQLSGWYSVIGTTESGSQIRIVLRLTLFNHGPNDLRIERALLESPYPAQGRHKSLIGIQVDHSRSQMVTEEYVLPRAALERIGKATPLKLVLDTRTGAGERHSETIVLVNRSTGEVN